MDLIVKPSQVCQFKCQYCSSTKLVDDEKTSLPLQKIFDFLKRFPDTNTIIFNGGDPLVMPPAYYHDLIDHLDEWDYPATISITTNLWGFWKNSIKWTPLFQNERVGVTTSFEFGYKRIKPDGDPYYVDEFLQIMHLFTKEIGYTPDFISVIDDDNWMEAAMNVRIAKQLGVENKLNYAMASGEQSKPFQLSRMYAVYISIYEEGLKFWEYNTKQMTHRLTRSTTTCPQSRKCDEQIRCLNPDGSYYSCGSFADDRIYDIPFEEEMQGQGLYTPLQSSTVNHAMKLECFSCPMFEICNGCKKTIHDHQRHNMVTEHCRLMKILSPKIVRINEKHKGESLVQLRESPSHFDSEY